MAAVQHTRTRSARLIANLTNKSAPPHGAPAAPPHAASHGTSPLSLFLTNLKLLDLDLRPDWPGISAETFATTGTSAQGQKKRVQCVEWALYQLFALWDADETRNRLKPFFPPLDQVQSINLRAALLRALEVAKKHGVLGRDAIVRKTMLDECRGERLEEVLASFSSAVLKHVISAGVAGSGEHTALALELGLEDRGYKDERTELNALVLAHKASLHVLLRDKTAAHARFRDFSDLLNVKERSVSRRNEVVHAKKHEEGGKTVSDDAKKEMWHTIRNNWSGNERWMETLLYGDANARKDGLFDMPFDRVWRRVQQGRLAELEQQNGGLLEQLDSRVRVQRERLEKWEGFRRKMLESRPRVSPSKQKRPKNKQRGIDLGFGAHEGLQVGRMSPRKATITNQCQTLNGEYGALVHGLKDELSRTETKESSVLSILQRPRASNLPDLEVPRRPLSPGGGEQEPTSDVSELVEDEVEAETFPVEVPIKSFQSKLESSKRMPISPSKRLPVRPKISHSEDSYTSNRTSSRTSSSSRSLRKQGGEETPNYFTTSSELDQSPDLSRTEPMHDIVLPPAPPPRQEDVRMPPPSPIREQPDSPMQDLADQILESMDQASPSPPKRTKPRPTLSLAERTRLSMARGSLAFPGPDDADLPLGPTAANSITPNVDDSSQTLVGDELDDLASRTRKSMAGFEKAKQKAQMERRRSLRKSKVPPRREGSYFPKVDEEDHEQSILAEELMAREDMEAVFRSRPKIAASPIPSPTKELEEDDYY
ncbi:Fc.00g079630.m01.CDS01 [Cosmosporella sp. VM-42]